MRKTQRVLEYAAKDLARYRSHLAYTRALIPDSTTQLEELREFIAEMDRRGGSLVETARGAVTIKDRDGLDGGC